MDNKNIKFWASVNKNGFLVLFTEQPKRNLNTGKWIGKYYCNSAIYKIIRELFDRASFNWEKEPEYFEFGPEQK
jgi:hypothetical protein